MKKLVLLLITLMLAGGAVFANQISYVSCAAPCDMSSGMTRVLTNATGSNVLAEQIAQAVIKKQLKKETGEKFKVKLNSYSVADLKNGRFKSLDISGKNMDIDGVSLSYIDFKTLCDFNYIVPDKKNNTIHFKEAFPMSYSLVMNEDDLNRTMNTGAYTKLIRDVNNFGKALSLFEINKTQAKIRNNQFMYVFNYSLPFLSGTYDLVVAADLKIVDGNIEFRNTRIANQKFNVDLSKMAKMLNYLNPLEFSLNILENNNTTMNVRNIAIYNNSINVNGTIIVDKDVIKEHKE